jgi:hypothetical protein
MSVRWVGHAVCSPVWEESATTITTKYHFVGGSLKAEQVYISHHRFHSHPHQRPKFRSRRSTERFRSLKAVYPQAQQL